MNDEEAGRSEIDFENGFDFLLDDIEDGTYDIYVDVVDLGDGDFEDAEILEVIESSEVERVTIDTEAPELVSIESDPDGDVETQELVTITVLSERGMKNASIIFDGEIYALDETRTGGKYEAEILMPNEAGIYTIDVLLIDSLGNEVQYRDQVSLNVQSETDEESEENQNSENNSGSGNSNSNTSGDFSAPTGLIASPGVEKVQLSWEPVTGSGVSKYRIFYGPSTESLFAVAETTDSSTSWTIPELIGGQAHYFTVAAVDSSGNEGPQSTAVLGVPRTLEEGDEIPQGPNGPAINDVSQLPSQQPDSGAPLLPFAALSLMGAAGFTRLRRLA